MTGYEFTGKTVEDAVEEGLKETGLTREEAEITVLEEGKKGLFKSVKAKVRIVKKKTDGERAVDFLDGVFEILNIAATNELVEDSEHTKINVITTHSDAVIGHRGEILDSLQVLAGAVANIGRDEMSDLSQFPSIKFGLETAIYDFSNGCRRIPFPSDFTEGNAEIPINGLVWMGTKEEMLKRIDDKIKAGFTTIKLKVGAIDYESELELVKHIRKVRD